MDLAAVAGLLAHRSQYVAEGTGLVLAQVYCFARQSGGVRLRSAPGGAGVALLLPLPVQTGDTDGDMGYTFHPLPRAWKPACGSLPRRWHQCAPSIL